jgi:hypothetical protein
MLFDQVHLVPNDEYCGHLVGILLNLVSPILKILQRDLINECKDQNRDDGPTKVHRGEETGFCSSSAPDLKRDHALPDLDVLDRIAGPNRRRDIVAKFIGRGLGDNTRLANRRIPGEQNLRFDFRNSVTHSKVLVIKWFGK